MYWYTPDSGYCHTLGENLVSIYPHYRNMHIRYIRFLGNGWVIEAESYQAIYCDSRVNNNERLLQMPITLVI